MSSSEGASDFVSASTNIGYIRQLADLAGTSEAALRLLLSVLAGYPVAVIHRSFAYKFEPLFQHIFFAVLGFLLCIFNYGFDAYHSMIAIWITYLLVRLLHNAPQQLLIINFVFHMSYLLIGYRFTESNNYDIIWTMPHCVLVLRLIGFGFDIADGRKPKEELSKDQKETALERVPSLIELAAYTYFPASFLVGPQFPFKRYERFIRGEFRGHHGSIRAGLIRGVVGVIYLAIRQLGAVMLPDSYLLTNAFRNQPMWRKCLDIGLWGKISLYKYISCWLLVEGALMCTGFTYAGKTADGKDDWSGCSNVKLVLLETGSKMTHYVQSFNVNTNNWVAQYVYKRLKFLNNRTISYGSALLFLALWHGFHSGYYMSFFMEYSIITIERQFEALYDQVVTQKYGDFVNNSKVYKFVTFILLKLYNLIYMGWCLTPFILLSYDRWMRVFQSLNYFGFIALLIWVIFYNVFMFFYSPKRSTQPIPPSKSSAVPSETDRKQD